MSLKPEKQRALRAAHDLILSLCAPGKWPTKAEYRRMARRALKHYPHDFDIIITPDCDDPEGMKAFRELKKRLDGPDDNSPL